MLNVAVVGAGYWGPNLVRNFNQLKGVRLHTVCDVDQRKLGCIKLDYPKLNLTKDYDAVLKDKEVDIVVISLPTQDHYWAGRKALLANKHTFVEKPLAITQTGLNKIKDYLWDIPLNTMPQ